MPKDVTNEAKVADTERKLGALAIAFSGVDLGLEKVFLALTGLALPVGGIIFYENDATSKRRQMVDKIAQHVLGDEPELMGRWGKLRDEHQSIHQRRNRFIHDLWAIDGSGEYATAKMKVLSGVQAAKSTFDPVDQNELVDLARRASDLMLDAVKLSIDVTSVFSSKSA